MKIVEIFQSIDGEVNCFGQGGLTTFIRVSGCSLNCSFCDTPQRLLPGEEMSIADIVEKVIGLACPKITITGGEPLLQYEATMTLIDSLLAQGWFKITVETNGSIAPPYLYLRKENLGWVFDYKFEYEDKMQLDLFSDLLSHNYIKFVIQNEEQYNRAKEIACLLKDKGSQARMVFSPCLPEGLSPAVLVDKLIKDKLWFVGLNLQIHKIINVK